MGEAQGALGRRSYSAQCCHGGHVMSCVRQNPYNASSRVSPRVNCDLQFMQQQRFTYSKCTTPTNARPDREEGHENPRYQVLAAQFLPGSRLGAEMNLEGQAELALGRERYSKEVEMHEQKCGNRNLLTCDMKEKTRPCQETRRWEWRGQKVSARQVDNREGQAQAFLTCWQGPRVLGSLLAKSS